MHVGWTCPGLGVFNYPGLDNPDGGPTSVRGTLMDYEEVQLAGDGELFIKSPYVAWKPEDTRVINYILARTNPNVPGDTGITPPMAKLLDRGWRLATNTRIARAEVKAQYGQILEENAAGDHVFFRVHKERK